MKQIEILTPVLPESINNATVIAWHKKVGDKVKQDEVIAEIETDKVVLEVVAEMDGVLTMIEQGIGSKVASQQVLGTLEEVVVEAVKTEEPKAPSLKSSAEYSSEAVSSLSKRLENSLNLLNAKLAEKAQGGDLRSALSALRAKERNKETPPNSEKNFLEKEEAKTIATEKVDAPTNSPVSPVKTETSSGLSVKKDIQTISPIKNEFKKTPPLKAETKKIEPLPDLSKPTEDYNNPLSPSVRKMLATGMAVKPTPKTPASREPMSNLRKHLANRLVEVKNQTAMLTTFNEVDMLPIQNMRKMYGNKFESQHGVRLGMMSFYVKACVEALKQFPVLNAQIEGEEIIYHGEYNINIAVSTPRGLVTPVIRNADEKSMAQIEMEIKELAEKARNNKLFMDDLSGGTFTITNGGVFGSLMSTPLINPPQSAILGMHAIKDRVVAVNGEIVIRPMMYLALSYDHRLIDGKDSVGFLRTVKELLEEPTRILLGV